MCVSACAFVCVRERKKEENKRQSIVAPEEKVNSYGTESKQRGIKDCRQGDIDT